MRRRANLERQVAVGDREAMRKHPRANRSSGNSKRGENPLKFNDAPMLKSLVDDLEKYTLPGPDGSFSEDEHTAFAEEIEKLLDRRSYFRDMWQEIAAEDEA